MSKKHKMGDCSFYGNWVSENQGKDTMYNSELNQICSNCEPNDFRPKEIEKLTNKFPDSVAGESSAGPIELAEKLNEVIDRINIISKFAFKQECTKCKKLSDALWHNKQNKEVRLCDDCYGRLKEKRDEYFNRLKSEE